MKHRRSRETEKRRFWPSRSALLVVAPPHWNDCPTGCWTDLQAGAYSAATHYLRAVQATGSTETHRLLSAMRDTPVNDMYTQGGRILENNKMVFDLLLARVKAPSASRYPWDYLEVIARIPAEEAFKPVASAGCSL